MVVFERIKWKNLLSTGNDWTEINLIKSESTLIVGENGSGKSTLIDALSFSLFGKAHRNINKNQLINSVNGKGTVVEVEFKVGSHTFKVIRGIKPNIFEIWQNGIMLNQSAAVKDYQKYLEQNILKLNHKSFHQIVVLGSSSFIPFMQLPTYIRREVIEDLLDIQIFSKMNGILKEQYSKLKESLSSLNYSLDIMNEKIALQEKYITDIANINQSHIDKKTESITVLDLEIGNYQEQNKTIIEFNGTKDTEYTTALQKLMTTRGSITSFRTNFEHKICELIDSTEFYNKNDVCPTCTQDITEELRNIKINEASVKAAEFDEGIAKAHEEIAALDIKMGELEKSLRIVKENNSKIYNNNAMISRIQKQIAGIKDEIIALDSKSEDLNQAKTELADLLNSKDITTKSIMELMESKLYIEAGAEMLKDTGIKTKIIKEYLPVINTLVNKYLQTLDFFVMFNLDEGFNEMIKSRHRDIFNYASFSEGEKMKIDLSLLFTWRQIAKMKNSTSTNLLVLDETFDSSLDQDGVDNLMKILQTVNKDTNVFVISHRADQLDGKFRSKIVFKKDRHFSRIDKHHEVIPETV